jgi:uncharacterized Zn-binding protein involved in type VI secretion
VKYQKRIVGICGEHHSCVAEDDENNVIEQDDMQVKIDGG